MGAGEDAAAAYFRLTVAAPVVCQGGVYLLRTAKGVRDGGNGGVFKGKFLSSAGNFAVYPPGGFTQN